MNLFINSYCKILIQDGFELKNNKTKFATNVKCVNVLGIELNNILDVYIS